MYFYIIINVNNIKYSIINIKSLCNKKKGEIAYQFSC